MTYEHPLTHITVVTCGQDVTACFKMRSYSKVGLCLKFSDTAACYACDMQPHLTKRNHMLSVISSDLKCDLIFNLFLYKCFRVIFK